MLAVALERNDSLHFLPTPILDISAALRTGEDAKALTKAMLDIERAIFVNLEGRQAAGLSVRVLTGLRSSLYCLEALSCH